MVSEFAIRRELAKIELTPAPPAEKAEVLLTLAKRVHEGALCLADISYRELNAGENARAKKFRSAMARLMDLEKEIRRSAQKLSEPTKHIHATLN